MSTGKKYLSLEEAAGMLKLKTEELIRLREKGEIRGFADRGTWKFKAGDIEEFQRRRQPDSDPDVAIMDDEDDDLGRQATVIRRGRESSSDSDVRLVMDEDLKGSLTGSSGELPVLESSKTDSDVKLISDSGPSLRPDSDSDVKLVNPILAPESDSDVKLIDAPKRRLSDSDSDVRLAQSDSDVKLVGLQDSDSDVKLIDKGRKRSIEESSDSDVALLPSSKGGSLDFDSVDLSPAGSALFDDDPGITLPGGDSGIRLGGADSGIRLGGADSGIQLMGGDSGIRLSNESGIKLQPADSGILLEGDSGLSLGHGDSSISLSDDSGMKLRGAPSSRNLKGSSSSKNLKGRKKSDDLDATAPMLLAQDNDDLDDLSATAPMLLHDDDLNTSHDVPLLSDDDDHAETSVIMFDEEDADQTAATVVRKGRKSPDDSMFDLDDDEGGVDVEEDDELEVSDEVLGEDDELEDLDAFESDDDEFDEGFEAGASRIGFASAAGKIAAPQEAEWGTGFFLGLLFSTAVLLVGALMSVDLLRTTWAGDKAVYQGELIQPVGDMFK